MWSYALLWRNNERNGVSNHRRLHRLLNRLFGGKSKKTSKLRVTGLCEGNPPITGGFPSQRASTAENVSIWWRHHGQDVLYDIETASWMIWKGNINIFAFASIARLKRCICIMAIYVKKHKIYHFQRCLVYVMIPMPFLRNSVIIFATLWRIFARSHLWCIMNVYRTYSQNMIIMKV